MTAPDEDPVDPREIDKALSELAGMTGRWSLFRKFLTEQLKVSGKQCESDVTIADVAYVRMEIQMMKPMTRILMCLQSN